MVDTFFVVKLAEFNLYERFVGVERVKFFHSPDFDFFRLTSLLHVDLYMFGTAT